MSQLVHQDLAVLLRNKLATYSSMSQYTPPYVYISLVRLLDFGRQAPEGDVDETCVALAGLRRSLIFPYLRVWDLGALVVKDVRDILRAGKRCTLRCLLQVCRGVDLP